MVDGALTRRLAAAPSAAARAHDWLVARRRGPVLAALGRVTQFAAAMGSAALRRAQRLAHLPGRRSDLVVHDRVAAPDRDALPNALVSYGWPLVLAPFAAVGGPAFVSTCSP